MGAGAVRRAGWLCAWLVLTVCLALPSQPQSPSQVPGEGQAQAESIPDPPLRTLRVFANLVQLPTLVLDDQAKPVPENAAGKFLVRLDGGPPFPVSHVRLEGDDPIALTVLIEATGRTRAMHDALGAALERLAEQGLRPHDRVSIYVIGCKVRRSADNVAPNAQAMQVATDLALSELKDQSARAAPACAASLPLWDTVLYVSRRLGQLPGRRVVLAITAGEDGGSQRTWREVLDQTKLNAVTIFGLRFPPPLPNRSSPAISWNGAKPEEFHAHEDLLNLLCQMSGGWLLLREPGALPEGLTEVLSMVRGRYIVQFPRGDHVAAGSHNIEVSTTRGRYSIRPAAVVLPAADPKLLADPDVQQNDPAHAPEAGKRKVLAPR